MVLLQIHEGVQELAEHLRVNPRLAPLQSQQTAFQRAQEGHNAHLKEHSMVHNIPDHASAVNQIWLLSLPRSIRLQLENWNWGRHPCRYFNLVRTVVTESPIGSIPSS